MCPVQESAGSANVYLRLFSSSTASALVNLSISALSNASASDYTISSLSFTVPANTASNTAIAVPITFTNDAIAESAEYIVIRFDAGTNMSVGTISQFNFYIADNDKVIPAPSNAIALNFITSFTNGVSGSNSAEIVAHDPSTQRLYIANSIGAKLDIINFANPASPSLLLSVPISTYGNINSVAVFNGTVACAIENSNPQDSGKVVFFNSNGVYLNQVKVGMMPDMITFNNAGTKVITANEGEPNAAYTNDPDGSVSIITITNGIAALSQTNVANVTFTAYNGQETALRAQGIRIYGLGANTSKDFEPEYVTVSPDDSRAWVTLQENNAIVEINLTTNTIVAIRALGTKDHSLLNNGMDMSNQTRSVNISNFPVKGFYLPDAIASYTVAGVPYLITANEGDSRAYTGFSEEVRVASAVLDATKFPNTAALKNNYALGRLNITNKSGDTDNDGDLDTLYSYGSRSFSIWNGQTGVQVYDSKDDLEQITASNSFSVLFNVSNTNNTKKDRSDDKGPEPEGVTIGTIGGNTYAFIALERIGGVMVYDVTNPAAPVYVTYVNNRTTAITGPDLGSEGLIFIPQSKSPNGQHLVIAANEVSSSLSIWGIAGCQTPINSVLSVVGSASNACTASAAIVSVPSATNLNYQWSLNGQSVSGATLSSITASVTGNYSVAIDGGTNCSTSSLSRSITVRQSPTLTVTGGTAACIGNSFTLAASGASTYAWSNGQNAATALIFPTSGGTVQVVGTSSNGCTASVTRTLSVLPTPQVSITALQGALCAFKTQSFSAAGAASYSWNIGGTSSVVAFSPANTTQLLVTGTSSVGCSNTATFNAVVLALPSLIVSTSTNNICEGTSVTMSASGASTYSWSNNSSSAVITITASPSAQYFVIGTGTNSCTQTLALALNVFANPQVTISAVPATICAGEKLSVTAGGAFNFLWSNGAIASNTSLSPTVSTAYSVTGTSANNCSSTVSFQLNVEACTGISELDNLQSITIYPNPANSIVFIQTNTSNILELEIFNAAGQTVMLVEDYVSGSEISIAELPNGLYTIKSVNDNTTITKRFVVAH